MHFNLVWEKSVQQPDRTQTLCPNKKQADIQIINRAQEDTGLFHA